MLIIGSQAIKYWFPDFPREPKDYDVVLEDGEQHNIITTKKVEVLSNPCLLAACRGYTQKYLKPNHIYTLKMSHLFWDINWEKHEWDATWLRERGCKLDRTLFYNLYAHWNEVHGTNKRSDLKMSSEKFFTNAVECEYDHDWLHTLLKPIPTFNKVLKDGQEVEVDYDKFQSLTEVEKEALVREEVYVMAFERWPTIGFRQAYGRMLKKFILSHAPIWEAIWILENYKKLCRPEFDFIKYFNQQINERRDNIVKRSTRLVNKQKQIQA